MNCKNCKYFERLLRNHFHYFHKHYQTEGISITHDLDFKAYENDKMKYDFIKTEVSTLGKCNNNEKVDPDNVSERNEYDDYGFPLFPKNGIIYSNEDRDGYRFGITIHENFGCVHFEKK